MIRVKVVKDREFKGDVMSELEKASQEFKRQFGVGFEISEISEWNSGGISFRFLDLFPFRQRFLNMLFGHLMRDLKRKVKVNGEIVVGFTGKVGSQHKKTFGLADSNYVLIGICQRPYSHVIIHEVGHVFGADDRPDSSVMSSQGFSYTYDFSLQDREIITRSLLRSPKES
ncbi:MAG: hypothetical protein NT012_02150 [Candidatus Nealsonbacteria bacterium]|jgi:hypothetical protein|nr:hypothetical protein [Candidatus Nealsonbacteria bacterium]